MTSDLIFFNFSALPNILHLHLREIQSFFVADLNEITLAYK